MINAGSDDKGIVALLSRKVEDQKLKKLGFPMEIEGVPIEYLYLGGMTEAKEAHKAKDREAKTN